MPAVDLVAGNAKQLDGDRACAFQQLTARHRTEKRLSARILHVRRSASQATVASGKELDLAGAALELHRGQRAWAAVKLTNTREHLQEEDTAC